MFDNEINDVYKKVDALFKLKIAPQVKGSGILFTKFWYVDDLMTGKKFYYLIIKDRYSIQFNEKEGLLKQLSYIVKAEEQEIDKEMAHLMYHKNHDLNFDAVRYDPQLDGYAYCLSKLEKLKTRLQNS